MLKKVVNSVAFDVVSKVFCLFFSIPYRERVSACRFCKLFDGYSI